MDDRAMRHAREPSGHRRPRSRAAAAGWPDAAVVERVGDPVLHRAAPRAHLRPPPPLDRTRRRACTPPRLRGHATATPVGAAAALTRRGPDAEPAAARRAGRRFVAVCPP